MESSPLKLLPPELMFQVLDLMYPHEYSAFPCTCQRALFLVNEKLEYESCVSTLTSWKCATAQFVYKQKLRFAPAEGVKGASECYGGIDNFNDPDL